MAKKITVGIPLFFNNKTNSGIVNYIFNIISALNTLAEIEKPKIVLLYVNDSSIDDIKNIRYPYIEYVNFDSPKSLYERVVNKLFFKFGLQYDRVKYSKKLKNINLIYPYIEFHDNILKGFKHKIHWLVDFNNIFFPNHYLDSGKFLNEFQNTLTSKREHLVLSSKALFNELTTYFPDYKSEVSILQFACSLPELNHLDISNVKKKYNLTRKFIMSPNQFWEHKNQLILIKALNFLKQKNSILDFDLVFTGSMSVNRGKGHMLENILELVDNYDLKSNIKFLGIINRDEQLLLMKDCVSLVQPSLYEGWSTLVEEAKALNQTILLSDLVVHHEQNCINAIFFNPFDFEDLAFKINLILIKGTVKKKIDYKYNILEFGKNVNEIFRKELKYNYD